MWQQLAVALRLDESVSQSYQQGRPTLYQRKNHSSDFPLSSFKKIRQRRCIFEVIAFYFLSSLLRTTSSLKSQINIFASA